MPFDDDDTKVRRNVVVASSAVILVWFLELPVSNLVGNALRTTDWHPSSWRIWAAILAVLFYLALRYRFTEDHKAVTEAIGDAYKQHLPNLAYALVTRELRNIPNGRRTTDMGFDCEALARKFRADAEGHIGTITSLELLGTNWAEQRSALEGAMTASVVAFGARASRYQGQIQVPYSIVGWKRLRCRTHAWLRSWVYSKEAVVYLAPAVLAGGAIFIAAFRVARELL